MTHSRPDPAPPVQTLTLRRPDDWHLHLRDGDMMAAVVQDSARQFGRAIVMPNLLPPVTTTAQACAYRDRILAALKTQTCTQTRQPELLQFQPPQFQAPQFQPLMTLYLTNDTKPDEIQRARESGVVHAVPGVTAVFSSKPASLWMVPATVKVLRNITGRVSPCRTNCPNGVAFSPAASTT